MNENLFVKKQEEKKVLRLYRFGLEEKRQRTENNVLPAGGEPFIVIEDGKLQVPGQGDRQIYSWLDFLVCVGIRRRGVLREMTRKESRVRARASYISYYCMSTIAHHRN